MKKVPNILWTNIIVGFKVLVIMAVLNIASRISKKGDKITTILSDKSFFLENSNDIHLTTFKASRLKIYIYHLFIYLTTVYCHRDTYFNSRCPENCLKFFNFCKHKSCETVDCVLINIQI